MIRKISLSGRGTSLLLFMALIAATTGVRAQRVGSSPEYIKALTSGRKGQRTPNGRPKVSDNMLLRLKNISLEEAWGILRNHGYQNQYEGDWHVIHPDSGAMTGRVVTAQYMPSRPDLINMVKDQGKAEGRNPQGGTNSWPIDVLTDGDVYVADGYLKMADGTLIGDNLGNAIYSRSHRGVIFYGSVRDEAGLSEINGFNGWVKGVDPSYIQQMMLTSINAPIRVGRAVVLPGDAVLANKYGVIFIPAHLLDTVVITAQFIELRDEFGHQRLLEKKYLAWPLDSQWSEEIKKDFLHWLDEHPEKLPMSRKELDEYMKSRTW